MKKIITLLSLVLISSSVLLSQVIKDYFEEEKDNYFYWYKIKIEINSLYKIEISDISNEIDSCLLKDFKKNQRKTMKYGSILIGPFETKEVVYNSLNVYESVKNDNSENNFNKLLTQNDSTYYFYVIHPFKNKRNGKFFTKRKPAAITEGTKDDFKEILTDIMKGTGMFLIGPFESILMAEESKRINRTLDKKRN